MLDKKTKERWENYLEKKKGNIFRGVYILHRHMNEWALNRWQKDGWGDIRPDHLRLVSIIGTEEVNVNELSKRARVTKQAMSKMVNDLISKGVIAAKPDPTDSRSKLVYITPEGVDFMEYFGGCANEMQKKITDMLGERKAQQLVSILGELSEEILEREKRDCASLR
jgi:DNA-binding MarR family transcriptional regulator